MSHYSHLTSSPGRTSDCKSPSVPDAPLTALGKKQAASLAPQVQQLQGTVDLIVSSPLQRTLQTTQLGWGPAVGRLGIGNVVCLPQAQECNDHPCDTGSSKATLESKSELAGFDFSRLTPDWTSKSGFWAADHASLQARAKWVRHFLREQPQANIVLVAHGDILRRITGDSRGPSDYMWRNAEVRVFYFDPATVEMDECFLVPEGEVAVAGGYGPTSSEADLIWEARDGKL